MSIREQAIKQRQTDAEARLKREAEVIDGRRDGKSFRQIALEQGRDVSIVHRDYQRGMDNLYPIENRETYRRLVMARLEFLFEDAMTGVKLAEGDREWRDNADVFLKVTDRVIKVMGLDKHEPEGAFEIDLTIKYDDIKSGMDVLIAEGLVDVVEVDGVTKATPVLPAAPPDPLYLADVYDVEEEEA